MRTATSICLLCQQNNSTKENSHIIPKFMTKSLLGENKVKRGYMIGSDRAHKAPAFSQDTAKEDFILCDSCEQYFSVLETYIATRLHNRLWDIRHIQQFSTYKNQGGITWKVCEQIDALIFRLFIYSIIWRCHISATDLCKDFALNTDESETLRTTLFSCKYDKQQDLLNNIGQFTKEFPTLPFLFFTADSFSDRTSNTLFINPSIKNPYQLVLNEYMLIFSFDLNEDQKKFDFLNNTDSSKIKIGYFPTELWESLRTQLLQMVVNKAVENMQKHGEIPWVIKQERRKND